MAKEICVVHGVVSDSRDFWLGWVRCGLFCAVMERECMIIFGFFVWSRSGSWA